MLVFVLVLWGLLTIAVGSRLILTGFAKSSSLHAAPSMTLADYSKFSHSSPKEHADLMARSNCASCHRRNDGSVEPKFPIHKDCTGCHLVQFTAANNSSLVNPICTICHKPEGLNSSNPPLKNSPRLVSFAAEFDHAQHLKGILRENQLAVLLHVAPVTGSALTPRLRLLPALTE